MAIRGWTIASGVLSGKSRRTLDPRRHAQRRWSAKKSRRTATTYQPRSMRTRYSKRFRLPPKCPYLHMQISTHADGGSYLQFCNKHSRFLWKILDTSAFAVCHPLPPPSAVQTETPAELNTRFRNPELTTTCRRYGEKVRRGGGKGGGGRGGVQCVSA